MTTTTLWLLLAMVQAWMLKIIAPSVPQVRWTAADSPTDGPQAVG